MKRRALIRAACAALAVAACPAATQAQSPAAPFPSRQVTLVNPYAAGGPSEPLLRPFIERLSKLWGQPVIIENKPGANGLIGTQAVMRAPGDGHTLLYHLTGMIQNPLLVREAKYDPFRDFKPVALFGTQPLVLAVSSKQPYKDMRSLIEAAKAPGANFSYGTVGAGSTYHLYGELLASTLGVDMTHVPYKGMAPLIQDLVPGRLPVSFVAALNGMQFSRDGSLRALAVTGPRRLRAMPDTPTMEELGMKGFELLGWYALFLPASVPDPLVERIARDARTVMQDPEYVQRLRDILLEPSQMTPTELMAFMKADYQKWGELIRRFNIKQD